MRNSAERAERTERTVPTFPCFGVPSARYRSTSAGSNSTSSVNSNPRWSAQITYAEAWVINVPAASALSNPTAVTHRLTTGPRWSHRSWDLAGR